MVTEYFKRTFYYSLDGETWEFIGNIDNVYYLSDEGVSRGKRFTGTMIGMYALDQVNGKKTYCDFDYFDYKELNR